ncbi:MAG: alpha/beta hydrolase [Pseudomonadota bacterium]
MGARQAGNCAHGEANGASRQTPWQAIASRLISDGNVIVDRDRGYGPLKRHRFDRYTPRRGVDPSRPTLIFVYGGSWRSGERACYSFVGSALAAYGFETLIPDYRLYPDVQFPAFVEDIALAYGHAAFGRQNDQPAPLLVGHSAGAHIAALLACDPSHRLAVDRGIPAPSGLVGLSGPYGFDPTTWETTKEIFATTADDPDRARPVAQARRRTPPTLLIHGARDTIVTPSAANMFADALRASGVDVTVRLYSGLAHIGPLLAMARPLRWVLPILNEIVTFANRQGHHAASRNTPG